MPQGTSRRRSPDRAEREVVDTSARRPSVVAAAPSGVPSLVALQRTAGNAAVAALLAGPGAERGRSVAGRAVQRSRIDLDGEPVPGTQEEQTGLFQQTVAQQLYPDRGPSVLTTLHDAFTALPARTPWDETQMAWLQKTFHQVYGTVISGHGALNRQMLAKQPAEGTRRRAVGTTFTVPQGVHLFFYLPDGALLEQRVANAIELGNPPSAGDVHLLQNGGSVKKPVPDPFPEVVGPGEQAENYTVSPPLNLTVRGGAVTVAENTLLSTLLERIARAGGGIVHFACCKRTLPGRRDWTGYLLEFRS
ncbi:putative adhesin [Cellulomonas sp. URHB0016]